MEFRRAQAYNRLTDNMIYTGAFDLRLDEPGSNQVERIRIK